MSDPRKIALDVLARVEYSGQYSQIALDYALKRSDLSLLDRGLCSRLVYGVLEKKRLLDEEMTILSNGKAIDDETRDVLRLGLYQLGFCDKIPAFASVNETVKLSPNRSRTFVNAILRAFQRNGNSFRPSCDAVKYSVCDGLYDLLVNDYGTEKTNAILSATETVPEITLRLNPLKTTLDDYLRFLKEKEIPFSLCEGLPNAVKVTGNPTELPLFSEGGFFVQDVASQKCVALLGAREGERILDCCSAPGSKAFGMAMDMKNKGKILACDLHENKLSLIVKSAQRLGLTCIETKVADGRVFQGEWAETFDKILCDAPCSGYGVLAKKPELRYKDPAESEKLPEIQSDILNNVCRYLKKGGRLVYSTCTLLKRENEAVINAFLQKHPDFVLESLSTLFPDTDGTDGFFTASLIKR